MVILFCPTKFDTVDGYLKSCKPVEVGSSSHYLQVDHTCVAPWVAGAAVRPSSLCPRCRAGPNTHDSLYDDAGSCCPVGTRAGAARSGAFLTVPRDATRNSTRGGAAGLSRPDFGTVDSPAGRHRANAGAIAMLATSPPMEHCRM